jgi:hypothetical protein
MASLEPTMPRGNPATTRPHESVGKVSGSSGAAAQLGIPASTLESKIRSLKINKYRFKEV